MTDEEKAEEYKADYGIDLCCLCRECEVEVINPCQHKKDAMYGYKDGFLAGLKAGRPQWHDLRKDPNDLPERMGLGSKEVYVAYKDGVTDFACYRFDKKYWERSEDDEQAVGVIAWCEIPTFDKE